jgi:hypothetical protein
MIHPLHFEALIVRPTLNKMAAYDERLGGDASVELMMGIAAQESDLGFWLRQHPTGPGCGFWSVEKATHLDVWRYLNRDDKADLAEIVRSFARNPGPDGIPSHLELIDNPPYSLAIARVRLWWVPIPKPPAGDIEGQGHYWNDNYNVNDDHGTVAEYVASYNKFVLRKKK